MGTAMDRVEVFGLSIAAVFSVVTVLGDNPGDPAALVAGVVLVAVISVSFGIGYALALLALAVVLMRRRAPRAPVAVPG